VWWRDEQEERVSDLREVLAKTIYNSTEAARAKEEGEPGVWVPWEAQTSRREQRVFRTAAEAVLSAIRNGQPPLTFAEVTAANLERCDRWHAGGIADWSVADWAVAMAGEAGEVCNAVKKLRRVEDEIANISEPDRQLSTRAEAVAKIGEEIADTFLYLNLLACRLGIDLPSEVVAKFNRTSERYGFPERLRTP
jgi:NTP pyrophosphatase (non-canonical NTP hydrolase)